MKRGMHLSRDEEVLFVVHVRKNGQQIPASRRVWYDPYATSHYPIHGVEVSFVLFSDIWTAV